MKFLHSARVGVLFKLILCGIIFTGVLGVAGAFHRLGVQKNRELTELLNANQPQRIIVVGQRITTDEELMYDVLPVNIEEEEMIGPPMMVGE